MTAPNETPTPAAQKQDNPLADIVVNVILPVLILSLCSKGDENHPWYLGEQFWHLGPYIAMGLAITIPLAYGIWHFIQHKKLNTFSAVGVFNVLLTGIITIYLFASEDPARRQLAPLLFGIKEAVQPLILGSLFILTHKSATPLFNAFVYNDAFFDHGRINKMVRENDKISELSRLLWTSTLLFFGSFCLSSVMNLGLAFYFLHDLDPTSENWKELYNKDVGRITGWGFLVIGVPLLGVGCFILTRMIKGLKALTGLETEKILQAR